MTLRAVRQCPVDPTPVVEEWIDQVELRFRYRTAVVRTARAAGRLDDPAPAARRVPARRGARARASRCARACGSRSSPRTSVVARSGERVTADAIVGADGANGVTAKAVGLGDGHRLRRRLRGKRRATRPARPRPLRPPARARARRHPGRLRLGLPQGRPRERRRRRLAERGAEAARAPPAGLRGARARPSRRSTTCAATGCRCGGPARGSPASARLLVGDAAGLIDPVSGDGMYECFVSSRLAAAAIARPARRDGRRRSRPTRRPSTRSSRRCTAPRGSSSRRSTAGRAPPGRSRARGSSGSASAA